jgi:hypothetical protein
MNKDKEKGVSEKRANTRSEHAKAAKGPTANVLVQNRTVGWVNPDLG